MAVILELLDPGATVAIARLRLDSLPMSIGRSLGSDILLEDPYADADHARIVDDGAGGLVLEDLGSVNGLLLPDGRRESRVPLVPGTIVRVGRTPLRFRDANEPLPPALPDETVPATPRLAWLGTTWGKAAAIVTMLAGFALYTWLGSYESTGANEAFYAAVGVAMLAGLWAGIWAIGGRVATHRFQFLTHMAIITAAIAAIAILGEANAWLEYLFPDNILSTVLGAAGALAVLAALVALHLRFASRLSRRARWTSGGIAAAAALTLFAASTALEDDGFTDVPEFSAVLKPAVRLVPTITPAEFRDVAADLRVEVDELRAEVNRRAGR